MEWSLHHLHDEPRDSNGVHCSQVCAAYADCYDAEYDVSECTATCRAEAQHDSEFEDRLETCESCIEGQSCVEATFTCADDCNGVVP